MPDPRPITPEEHRAQIQAYEQEIDAYRTWARVLRRALEQGCKATLPGSVVQSREKSVSSFAEKAARRFKDHPDPVRQFTDLCGARVIVQTTEQVAAVRRFIEANFRVLERDDKVLRLSEREFGYRDLHFVVERLPSRDEALGIAPEERERIGLRRAEIQVRTWLQHAWADTLHDRIYKNKLTIPGAMKRTGNLLAALVEEGDRVLDALAGTIDGLIANYSSHATREELQREVAIQELVLGNERDAPRRLELALGLARLLSSCGEHERVVRLLREHADARGPRRAELLLRLGWHACQLHRGAPRSEDYRLGVRQVRDAVAACEAEDPAWVPPLRAREGLRARAWHSLGRVLQADEDALAEAARCHQLAHEREPHNPYYLAEMLGFEVYRNRGASPADTLRATIREALATCREHAEAAIELPDAFFTSARLHLLLGEGDLALSAVARGLRHLLAGRHCVPPDALEAEATWVKRLHAWQGERPAGCQRVLDLLALGQRLQAGGATAAPGASLAPPVLIVAGAAASLAASAHDAVRDHLAEALQEHRGTVLSGGTTAGVPGCLGDAAARLARAGSRRFELVGYVPHRLPLGVSDHRGYDRLVKVGDDFSADQVLRNWSDILDAGIDPREVRVLGFGGGPLAAVEYRIALGLGAQVGVVQDFAGASDELLRDALWSALPNLHPLPDDAMTIRAFLRPRAPRLDDAALEGMARLFHARYVAGSTKALPDNLKPWDKLNESYRRANLEQAAAAVWILESHGFGVRRAAGPAASGACDFTDDEVESMARMEHGRWNVERLADGWRLGARDDATRRHPCLVPWETLPDGPDGVRRYDRDAVRAFPEILAEAGLEVFRRPAGKE